MLTVYAVQVGVRYVVGETVSVHATLSGALAAAAARASPSDEQDPPADGFLASWLDAAFNFVGVKAMEETAL